MITFKEYLSTLEAIATGIHTEGHSREGEFTSYFRDDYYKLLTDKISSKNYKIYYDGFKPENRTYYLTDANDKYLGHIEMYNSKIGDSHSEIDKGFYNLMFTSILSIGGVNEIFSDVSLSENAINAYDRLNKSSNLKIQVLTHEGYFDFSIDKLLEKSANRVSIKLKHYDIKEEVLSEYFRRKEDYLINNRNEYSLDMYLLGEDFNDNV